MNYSIKLRKLVKSHILLGMVGLLVCFAAAGASATSSQPTWDPLPLWAAGTTVSWVGSPWENPSYPLSNLIDGSGTSMVQCDNMATTVFKFDFTAPTLIEDLGIVQYGWNGWAVAKTVNLDFSNGASQTLDLELQQLGWGQPYILQSFTVNQTCSWFTFSVVDAYIEGATWGGIGEVAPLSAAPVPEPSSVVLLSTGLIMTLGAVVRRRF